jgi:integrase/recombinase XerC
LGTSVSQVQEFLTHLEKERDVSPHTVKAYGRDLHEFTTFLAGYYGRPEGRGRPGGRPYNDEATAWSWQGVDRLAIRGFLAHLSRRGLSKRSIGRALAAVRTFYKYLHLTESVDVNPARAVSTPKQEKYLPGYLSRAQADDLFRSAEARAATGRFADVRNLAVLELFYSTGMRLAELRGLNRTDIDLLSQQVKVRGKGR